MANRWIGVTLLCCWLGAAAVHAQGPPAPGCCGGSCLPCGPGVPGPLGTEQAPQGPPDCLSLPASIPNAFSGNDLCNKGPCGYVSAEYLLWAFKEPRLPDSLITENGASLVDTGTLRYGAVSGARVNAGIWLDPGNTFALEGSGFITENKSARTSGLSDPVAGTPAFAIPFLDAFTGTNSAFNLSVPGSSIGGFDVTSRTQLWGASADFVLDTPGICCIPLTLMAGGRYVDLSEALDITGFTMGVNGATASFAGATVTAPAAINTFDSFHTRNQFYGGELGIRTGFCCGCWFIGGQAKIAAGGVHETFTALGMSTLTTGPGALPTTVPGGVLTGASNANRVSQDKFAYIPEGEVRVGVHLSDCWLVYIGYNFLWMSNVARAGDQVDQVVDTRQQPTSPNFQPGVTGVRPVIPMVETSFWAQGLTFGVELTY